MSARNRLEIELECKTIDEDCNCNAMTLCKLVWKTRNELAAIVTDNVLDSMVESVYNLLLIRGDKCSTLSKHLEAIK